MQTRPFFVSFLCILQTYSSLMNYWYTNNSFFRFIREIFFPALTQIIKDIGFLYSNFLHWNISKFFIALTSWGLAFLLSFPFFLCAAGLMFLDPINWKDIFSALFLGKPIGLEILAWILGSPFFVIFEFLFLIWAFIAAIAGYSYGIYLKVNLYIAYHQRKKLWIMKNEYFKKTSLLLFLKVFFLNLFYILLPFFLFICIWIFLSLFSFLQFISFNFFSYTLFGLLVITALLSFYIAFRVVFSYIEISREDKNDMRAGQAIKKSYASTGWISLFFSFLSIFFIFFLVSSPIEFGKNYIDSELTEIKDFVQYSLSEKDEIPQEDIFYVEYLQKKYGEWGTQKINQKQETFTWIQFFYSLCILIFLDGVSFQIFVSYYLLFCKEMKEKKKSLFSKLFLWKF